MLAAAPCFAAAIYFFSIHAPKDPTPDEKLKELGFAFIGFLLFAAGAAVLIFPLGRFLSSIFESLFWPTDTYLPPPLFKLAAWYVEQGRYAEALAEYEKILKHHRHNSDAYRGLLYVLHACMGDVQSAEKIYQKARKKVPEAQRDALAAYYQELKEGRASPPNISAEPQA